MVPLLSILHQIFNLAIGHTVEEGKYLNFGNRLTLQDFRNYLLTAQDSNPLLTSYGWDLITEIAATVLLDDQRLELFFETLFEQLLKGVFLNTLNFNDNQQVNTVLTHVFVLL